MLRDAVMNAVAHLVGHLPREAIARMASRASRDLDDDARRADVVEALADNLSTLLNACRLDELTVAAKSLNVSTAADPAVNATHVAQLRQRLWRWGAIAEAGTDEHLGTALQPIPALIAGRLVHQAAPDGLFPPSSSWPRPVLESRDAEPPDEEPDSIDELLFAADRALGVRLGSRGVDKGAWGVRAASLLGVMDRGDIEPDWRGDVELKTVPVVRDRSGLWKISEDPAICMVDAAPIAKLQRVLWLVRASLPDDAVLLSWYLMTWNDEIARLVTRDLHTRPKGPKGTSARAYYLHKRFFADVGLLATLNGPVRR